MSHPDKLTKTFLENALNRKLISISVAPGTKPGDNYMSTIYSIEAFEGSETSESDSDSNQIVHNWIFKCLPNHPLRQEFAIKSNMFYKELFIYTTWVEKLRQFQQHLKLQVPLEPAFAEFIGGRCMDFRRKHEENQTNAINGTVIDPLENFMVLRDLRPDGYKMCDRQVGLDFDHLRLVVIELAKYHGICWAYRSFHNLETITSEFPIMDYQMDKDDLEVTLSILKESITASVKALDDHAGEVDCHLSRKLFAFEPQFENILRTFYSKEDERRLDRIFLTDCEGNDELWRVMCHGDAWINNILFKYLDEKPNAVVLIDHAVARDLCPTVELAYLMYTSTSYETRMDSMGNLLEIYHDEFLKTCETLRTPPLPNFSLEMLRRKFRRAKLYGFAIAVMALPAFLKDSDEIINLDDMPVDLSEDYSQMFKKSMNPQEINPVFQERIVGLIKEMEELGIFK